MTTPYTDAAAATDAIGSSRGNAERPKRMNATVPQASLEHCIAELDGAGLLYRHEGEARVDELPQMMEHHPDQAVFVERVRDCEFPFLASASAE